MEIKALTNRNLPKVSHKINNVATSISYKTVDNKVLKRYILNSVYLKMIESHEEGYLNYLKELSSLESDLIVQIETALIGKNNMVGAVIYPYQVGVTLNELYSKVNLELLRDALKACHELLLELDSLKLKDIHYRNILYTGDIKIIDLDFCEFSSELGLVRRNIKHVNNYIIRGLFKLDIKSDIKVDPRIKNVFDSVMAGECGAYEFLDEYMILEGKNKGKCKYYKHLTKDYISEVPYGNR